MSTSNSAPWIALVVGNSRLHWAVFVGSKLYQAWDTPHLSEPAIEHLISSQFDPEHLPELIPRFSELNLKGANLKFASVVSSQGAIWQSYPKTHVIALEDIPIQNMYPTLGIDRALALWGAASTWGFPALAIDAGTALTFTGADVNGKLVGGAILPGLQLQMRSLSQNTSALPFVATRDRPVETRDRASLPVRWATNTQDAMRSGVIYSSLSGMRDFVGAWLQEFPKSAIAITGGDGELLFSYLKQLNPDLATHIQVDPHLLFRGLAQIAAS